MNPADIRKKLPNSARTSANLPGGIYLIRAWADGELITGKTGFHFVKVSTPAGHGWAV